MLIKKGSYLINHRYFNPGGVRHDAHLSLMGFVIRNHFSFNSNEQHLQSERYIRHGNNKLTKDMTVGLPCMVVPELIIGVITSVIVVIISGAAVTHLF